MTSILPNHQRK